MDVGISELVVLKAQQVLDSALAEITTGRALIVHSNQQDFLMK
jgi:hypothetical protein